MDQVLDKYDSMRVIVPHEGLGESVAGVPAARALA